jgi:hypothetical protein
MKKYYFKQNEVTFDNKGNFYNPHYSTKKADKYFNLLIYFQSSDSYYT